MDTFFLEVFDEGYIVPKKEKGKSHSIRPIGKRSPNWCKYQPEEVESLVVKLAGEENSPSKIGVILRDQYGIPLVKQIVGKSILDILKENNLKPAIPEDIEVLMRKVSRLYVHLENNKNDKYNKKSVQVIESKIHDLAKYYKRKGMLPEDWKYAPAYLSAK